MKVQYLPEETAETGKQISFKWVYTEAKYFMLENPSLCNFCCDFMICCSRNDILLFWWSDKCKRLNLAEAEQKYSGEKITRRKDRPKEQGICDHRFQQAKKHRKSRSEQLVIRLSILLSTLKDELSFVNQGKHFSNSMTQSRVCLWYPSIYPCRGCKFKTLQAEGESNLLVNWMHG